MIRRSHFAALTAAGLVIAAGLVWGVVVGEPRIGVAVTAAAMMILPWRPVEAPAARRGSPAAGWRLVGVGIATLGGLEGIAEWFDLPVQWRTVLPTALALPVAGVGLWWAVVRPRRATRTAVDALLVGSGIALLSWLTFFAPRFGGDTQSGAVAVALVLLAGCVASLVWLSRTASGGAEVEVVLALVAATAYVTAVLLVGDTDMIMRSWSAAADATGHAVSAATVILGQRRAAPTVDASTGEVKVRWLPSLFTVAVLLTSIAWVSAGQGAGDAIQGRLTMILLVGLAVRVVLAGRDWQAARRHLERLAHFDDVTGLRSRAWLTATLAERLADGQVLAVLMLDLDRFKLINDGLGHHVGDRVLAVTGDRLQQLAGTDEVVRLGGDEFLVLLGPSSPMAPEAVAEQLREALAEPIQFDSYALRPTVSIGVAVVAPGSTTSTLLRDADTALYRAKQGGRDAVAVVDDDLRRSSRRTLDIAEGLQAALDRGEFSLRFQPIVAAHTGQVVVIEALARWHSPTLGVVEPAEFVTVAKQHGLIGELNRWVVQEVCASVARLDTHPEYRGAAVAVNVASSRLAHLDFVDFVIESLHRAGVEPGRLMVEVTESALLNPHGLEVKTLERLARAGVGIALDDFGSGYTAFGYLPNAPLDLLKLDPSFTRRLGASDRPTLVGVVIDMAHDLGIRVVAEGLETDFQRRRLVAMGCDFLQGHLVAAPAALDVLLAEHPVCPAV